MTTVAPARDANPNALPSTAPAPSSASARWDEAPHYLLSALFRPAALTVPVSRTLTSGALFGWAVGCSLVAIAITLGGCGERVVQVSIRATVKADSSVRVVTFDSLPHVKNRFGFL